MEQFKIEIEKMQMEANRLMAKLSFDEALKFWDDDTPSPSILTSGYRMEQGSLTYVVRDEHGRDLYVISHDLEGYFVQSQRWFPPPPPVLPVLATQP